MNGVDRRCVESDGVKEAGKRVRSASLLSLLPQQQVGSNKRRSRAPEESEKVECGHLVAGCDTQLLRGVSSSSYETSCSATTSNSSTGSSPPRSPGGELEDTCFICMGAFTRKHPAMAVPCQNRCNKSPVHGKCIYEWSETKQSRVDASSCPLCRGPLENIAYKPRDKIGSHRFGNFDARREFLLHPVPQRAGVVRCFVRAVRQNYLRTSTRYELYLQAPTTLEYPLGPLPSLGEPRPGDVLLAVSHKHINKFSCTHLDITMDTEGRDFSFPSPNYLGSVYSSFTGLEHTIVAPSRDPETGKFTTCELGAIRYTQNRIDHNVGPRRINVCFPRVVKTVDLNEHQEQQHLQEQRQRNAISLNDVVPHPAPETAAYEMPHKTGHLRSNNDDYDTANNGNDNFNYNNNLNKDTDDEDDEVYPGNGNRRRSPSWSTMAYKPEKKTESLWAILRAASQSEPPASNEDYLFGCNKTPYWLPAINAFSLDFGGRVTLPSNKNFQLIMNTEDKSTPTTNEGAGPVSLQFGKIAESDDLEVFTLDVAFPLSPVQAFGVALSACDRKFLCV
mmetsp:Transcript_23970/g.42250  ORF Transcript_23970/g.42250 Transcript_23970/m.42250 type:complete len:561 (-) Transcript_23970:103-1785(-)